MDEIYVCKVTGYQATGNQIDIPRKIAISFFNVPEENIISFKNATINLCHISDTRSFETIEIQPATNPRLSARLISYLASKGDHLSEGTLLVFEKLGRSFCVRTIPCSDSKYGPLVELFEDGERHMLLFASLLGQPQNTENISQNYRQYITAAKSKPFILLAGISGTGKSRIVRELARACWAETDLEFLSHKPRNFEMIQVKPNWHDSCELLGYVSRIGADKNGDGITYVAGDFLKFIARAWEEIDVPYFLCLDEMNLAPVEQYFAEYLSVIESRKVIDNDIVTDPIVKKASDKWYENLCNDLTSSGTLRDKFMKEGISLPKNLIVIGTVNMDETTYSFSRKVLDRAFTIEMNEVNLWSGLDEHFEKIGKLGKNELIANAVEGTDVYKPYKEVCDLTLKYLQSINESLEGTPFKVAYRTRNDFLLYVTNNLAYNINEFGQTLAQEYVIARALDEITNMKILSRIEGDETKVNKTFLEAFRDLIQQNLNNICAMGYSSVAVKKLNEMILKLSTGYTSFWS